MRITNKNSQRILEKYGVWKPATKKEYKGLIPILKKALIALEEEYKELGNQGKVDGSWRLEGINSHYYQELNKTVTKLYKLTTKKEMDKLYNGVMRSVNKLIHSKL